MRALGQDSKHNREPLVLLESLPKFYRYCLESPVTWSTRLPHRQTRTRLTARLTWSLAPTFSASDHLPSSVDWHVAISYKTFSTPAWQHIPFPEPPRLGSPFPAVLESITGSSWHGRCPVLSNNLFVYLFLSVIIWSSVTYCYMSPPRQSPAKYLSGTKSLPPPNYVVTGL